MSCYFRVCFFLLISFMASSIVWAQAEFHPRISLSEEYNDNIFLAEDNEQDDWITTVSPGFNLTYKNKSIRALIDYNMRFRFYADHTEENDDRFKDVQRGSASLWFFEGRPFTLKLSENITREAIDQRDTLFSDGDLTDSTTIYKTLISPQYRWHLAPTWSLVTSYDFHYIDYVDEAGDDYLKHVGRLSLQKELSSNTTLSANATYTISDSDDERDDHTEQNYTFGINHQVGPRTSLSFEGGYSLIEYDTGGDSDSITIDADLRYKISAVLTYFLTYSQDYDASVSDGLTENKKASTGIEYKKGSLRSSVSMYWNSSDYERTEEENELFGAKYDLDYPLSSSLSSHFDIGYEHALYDPEDKNVDSYHLGTSIAYKYRRIKTSLGYRLKIKDSDSSGSDYTNNIITLTAGIHF